MKINRAKNLTVACVLNTVAPTPQSLWQGKYTPECVYALRNMVRENLSIEHKFVCLSDVDLEDIDTIPLVNGWLGWWSKIELFRPGLFDGTVLYFDLDTFINKPIDALVDIPGNFTMIRDLYHPDRPASGMMMWGGNYSSIYENFKKYMPRRLHGDQQFIAEQVSPTFFQDYLPEGFIKSFKAGGRGKDLKNTPIVCFHGEPKPHDSDGWIREYWESKLEQ